MSAVTSPEADARPRSAEPVRARRPRLPSFLRNPWGKPRFLVATTWLYMLWALAPVAIAILFSFNAGKSRSNWQGFSTRWWWGNPTLSVFNSDVHVGARAQPAAGRRSTWRSPPRSASCSRSAWRAGAAAARAPPTR